MLAIPHHSYRPNLTLLLPENPGLLLEKDVYNPDHCVGSARPRMLDHGYVLFRENGGTGQLSPVRSLNICDQLHCPLLLFLYGSNITPILSTHLLRWHAKDFVSKLAQLTSC